MADADPLIIEKLKKLIALSGSPNEAESASALAKAHTLLARHGLTMTDLEKKEEHILQKAILSRKRLRNWESALLAAVMAATYTEAVILPGEGKVCLVGREVNIIAAENLFEYLRTSILMISRKHAKSILNAESFRLGMVVSINERLKKLDKDCPPSKEEKQLVLSAENETGRENREYLDKKYGRLRKKRIKNRVEPLSYGMGHKAGGSVSLNLQIDK